MQNISQKNGDNRSQGLYSINFIIKNPLSLSTKLIKIIKLALLPILHLVFRDEEGSLLSY